MDIKELQNYRLSDAIKFHQTLNPKIWGRDERLLPEVREKLLAIAADFQEFLGLDIEVKDITISGSNAAYTYTDHSDIDLHLVADLPRADRDDVYRELFDAKKYQYNDQHDFVIGGYPVELYVQNANEDHVSQGIYSVTNDTWISVPKRRQPDINDISVRSKYEDMGQRIDAAIESGDQAQMDAVSKKLRAFRQSGLDAAGEFSPENLAFKVLRNNGTLDRLRAARTAAKNQAMSLTEKKKKRKKKMRYGSFGGAFFPGYHYYGQTDSAADGGDGGGGESVQEQLDVKTYSPEQLAKKHAVPLAQIMQQLIKGVRVELEHTSDKKVAKEIALDHLSEFPDYYDRLQKAETNESVDPADTIDQFVDFCADHLGLQQRPQVTVKRDTAWSERNATFGRYMPDNNTLTVSVANRHPLDIMRTLAHELTHHRQQEQQDMPMGAGETGSEFENEANAEAGVIMRKFAELHPEYFGKQINEASGYIPVTDAEAKDPRYSMAVTADIRPGEPQRQAAKMGWKTNPAGTPPTAKTNGLVEALTRKLQLVKEGFEPDLEEVAMSPSSLKAFVASDLGQDMMAGFEAELIFTGLAGDGEMEPDWEPDYDQDERADSIDDVIEFFQSGDFADLSDRGARELRDHMYTDYQEWLYEQMNDDWDREQEDFIRDYLVNEEDLEGEELDERVAAAIEEQNRDYDNAREAFDEDWMNTHELDDGDWLRSQGIRYMSDAERAYDDLSWPHYQDRNYGSSEGGFNEDNAQRLADDLTDTLDVETTVSGGYHSARRDAKTWIFEPDSSLDANDNEDMPVEIVSPPMPLGQALEILPKFFEWAKANGAYANKSTGFHMSVSMPDHGENVLDYTKLALFLGDEYVLKQFGREANTYARSAISKIRDSMGKSLTEATETRADAVLSAMRNHLNQFASRAIAQPSGFGKYTSINPKSNYIEFRSAGGSDYFDDIDKIQNTLMRYARATDIAMDPAAEKQEYAKKLYKLLTQTETQQVTDPKTGRKRTEVKGKVDNDAISIFSRYVAGELPKSELKGFLKQLQYGREVAKNPPKEKIQWKVTHPNRRATITLMASSAEEAIKLAKQEYNDTMNPDDAYRAEPVAPATQTPATDQMTAPAADDPGGNYVLRRREGSEGTGAVVYRFSAPNNAAAIEAARQWTTARGLERRSVWLDHVSGVPPEVLNAPRTSTQSVQSEPQNFPAAQQPTGQFTGEWQVMDGLGREVHRFGGIGNAQSDANRVAREWAQRTGFDGNLEVYPVMR